MHEVRTTLRWFKKDDESWVSKNAILSDVQSKAIKSFVKFSSQTVFLYLVATSLRTEDQISITIADFEASVPATYFFFIFSLMFFFVSIYFNHMSVAVFLKAHLSRTMQLHGFSTTAYDVLKTGGETELGLPQHQNQFLTETFPTSNILSFVTLAIVFATLIPLTAIGFYLCLEQWELLKTTGLLALERVAVGIGLSIVVFAFLNVLLFQTPLPMKKNKFSIRWGFLVYISDEANYASNTKRWLQDKK